MALPYSVRLVAWESSTLPTPYVVPAGYVVVLRDVDVTTGGGAITNFEFGINGVCKLGGGAFTVESVFQQYQWRGRQIVQAGEELFFTSDVATDGAMSGYLLGFPPF